MLSKRYFKEKMKRQPIKLFKVKEKQEEALMKQSVGELRLQKDISELSLPKSCSIKFPNGKFDPTNFEVSIVIDGGYYLGCTFVFSFHVSPIYPHEAPKVKCKTKVYHPKIDLEGNVCLNILKEDWTPSLDINNVIYGLYNLLKDQNYEDPLNHDVFKDNPKMFKSDVRVQSPNLDIGSMEHLPQELFCSILSMLPARELFKCKCVCKSWFDLISDPHFVTNYYVDHNTRNCYKNSEEHLLVIRREPSSPKSRVAILSWNVNKFEGLVSSEAVYSFDKYKYQEIYGSQILGPCNGTYFLEGDTNVIINPSLRQFKPLVGSLGLYPGFGFDPITNDYKVVFFKYISLKETNERKVTAELYSLNFNSWRKLDDEVLPLPFKIWGSCEVYTYVNNCFHWWGYVDESGRKDDIDDDDDDDDESGRKDDIVLSFNMVTELFRKIKVPKIRSSARECFTTLAPFNDATTIGAIVYPWRRKENLFDIWVMKDYWNEGSWIKQYTVGPVQGLCGFVGFYGNNQFLWKDNRDRLVLHELGSERTRGFRVYKRDDLMGAARYMESLVSLHSRNEK